MTTPDQRSIAFEIKQKVMDLQVDINKASARGLKVEIDVLDRLGPCGEDAPILEVKIYERL